MTPFLAGIDSKFSVKVLIVDQTNRNICIAAKMHSAKPSYTMGKYNQVLGPYEGKIK